MKENMTTNNKPAFEIFVVREGSNKKSYFTKIGAAWPTKSGSGYNADLIAEIHVNPLRCGPAGAEATAHAFTVAGIDTDVAGATVTFSDGINQVTVLASTGVASLIRAFA